MLRGLDVSHHQNPDAINWDALAETHQFVYVRATYGGKIPGDEKNRHIDRRTAEHVRRARAAGLSIGLYHFFRQPKSVGDSERSVVDQLDAFNAQAEAVGLGPGDMLPAIDLEDDPPALSDPLLYAAADRMIDALSKRWGGFVTYTTAEFWNRMGRRQRWLDGFLWVAHWRTRAPITPDNRDWHIWQLAVEPLHGVYASNIDHNVARTLPLIPSFSRKRVEQVIALNTAGMVADYFDTEHRK